MPEIVDAFVAAGGSEPRVSFGSSGNLFRQIRQGAPFELFLSADEQFVGSLVDEGRTLDTGALYASGRVVLFVPLRSPLLPDGSLEDLRLAAGDGRLRRLAIANPAHAPYGRAAREALEHRGLWSSIEPRLVVGENASQAVQFALSGGTEGGIVPYSLILAPRIAPLGTGALIPRSWHSPIRHRVVLLDSASADAGALYRFLQQGEARAILERYGFIVPEGEQ
jgi:molybdate transport system substrate-binding protein